MQGNIEKTAKKIENYKRDTIFYKNARSGFSEILKYLKNEYKDYTLLLPGFIGYSPREGSGIYDPIINNEIQHIFYPIDENINIAIKEYEKIIRNVNNQIVVLIVHYFGYIDPNIEQVIKIAREKDAFIIEDCAHALYTDYIDNSCGYNSDVSIYSLHKMLPYEDGGMVRINNKEKIELQHTNYNYNILEYNLNEIAKKRKQNAQIIERELRNVEEIRILRPIEKYKSQTPQTYPIIIEKGDKNQMYHKLNENGFGVVSLYHTMIQKLQTQEYEQANQIANKILNLPVHQDVTEEQLIEMCKMIKNILGDGNEKK